jgi:hypothetical protein
MRTILAVALLGWLFWGAWNVSVCADGGAFRFAATKSGYNVSVFTAPTPLRAGLVDVSVLVLDASTGAPVTQLPTIVRMTMSGCALREYPATSDAATNKLFQAAQFELPKAGLWDLQVKVDTPRGAVMIGGTVEAAPPLPRWWDIMPWIGWPALAVALFGVHQVLVRRSGGISRS